MEQARAWLRPNCRARRLDLSALTDILDPTFNRLRDAIQAQIIVFDSNAPRPAQGQETVLDSVAAELRDLIQVANGLGFSARVMIVGHTDTAGKETSNLALGQARRNRAVHAPRAGITRRLAIRGAGILEPRGRATTQARRKIAA